MVLSFFTWDSSPSPESSASPAPPKSTIQSDSPAGALGHLLQHYANPGAIPPAARVDPTIKQREPAPLFTLKNVWRYGFFFARKSTELAGDLISHHVFGPRRPSWGLEMTIVSSVMRNLHRHSGLANMVILRTLMQVGGMVPLPSDALITPVSFKVPRRNLRGILAEFDTKEDGERELSGEWVVGTRLWMKLQNEWRAGGGTNSHQAPHNPKRMSRERVILYLHGGAYYLFSAATHRLLTIPLSKYTNTRIFALNYRLAPETRFPGPLHDAVSAYFRLIEDLNIPPENIIIAGDSAGGGLSLALLMYLRDNGYPLPTGGILMSPWVDLTMSCDSWDENADLDVCPRPSPGDALNPILCYLGDEGVEQYLTHPYASPLFGSFVGLPPLLVQSGDAEVLRDEITLLAHKATLDGVKVTHELYEDAVHVFQMLPFLDQARQSFQSCREFVLKTIPAHQSSRPRELDNTRMDSEIGDRKKMRVVNGAGTVENSPVVSKASLDFEFDNNRPKSFLAMTEEEMVNGDAEDKQSSEEESEEDQMGWSKSRGASISLSPSIRSTMGLEFDSGDESLFMQSRTDGTTVDLADGNTASFTEWSSHESYHTKPHSERDDDLSPSSSPRKARPNALPKFASGRAKSYSSLASSFSLLMQPLTATSTLSSATNPRSGHHTPTASQEYHHASPAPSRSRSNSVRIEDNPVRPIRNHTRRKTTTATCHPGSPRAIRSSWLSGGGAQTPTLSASTGGSRVGSPTNLPSSLAPPMIKPPSIRARNRAFSHPDIFDLCRDWMEAGPANSTVTYKSVVTSEEVDLTTE